MPGAELVICIISKPLKETLKEIIINPILHEAMGSDVTQLPYSIMKQLTLLLITINSS